MISGSWKMITFGIKLLISVTQVIYVQRCCFCLLNPLFVCLFFFLTSRCRRVIGSQSPYCLPILVLFVHQGFACKVQGKLLFSTFLTRKEGTTDESKKRLGCYQQGQFNLPREYSIFDGSQCILNNKKLKMRRRRICLLSVLENFRPGFSPDPTNCPWVC